MNKHPTDDEKQVFKLTLKEQIFVLDLLKEHCEARGDTAVYNKGWDDDVVLHALVAHSGYRGGTSGVARIRKEIYGQLKTAPTSAANNVDRLEKAERAVKYIRECVRALYDLLGEPQPEEPQQ